MCKCDTDNRPPAKGGWIGAAIRIAVVAALTFGLLQWLDRTPKDSTDSADSRSGMILYIDDFTGCHYLSTPLGLLTPRLDPSGRQICSGPEGGDDPAWHWYEPDALEKK